jgi:hypothetical protein
MKSLTKAMVLEADDLKHQKVEVPEWGGSILVLEMNGLQREQYETKLVELRHPDSTEEKVRIKIADIRRVLLTVTLASVDDQQPLFTEKDIPALEKKNAKVLDRLFKVATDVNDLFPETVEKNLGSVPTK